jgi:hypothetical protein
MTTNESMADFWYVILHISEYISDMFVLVPEYWFYERSSLISISLLFLRSSKNIITLFAKKNQRILTHVVLLVLSITASIDDLPKSYRCTMYIYIISPISIQYIVILHVDKTCLDDIKYSVHDIWFKYTLLMDY